MNNLARQLLILFLLIVSISRLSGQTYSSLVSDDEISRFMTWLINKDRQWPGEQRRVARQFSQTIIPWDSANFILKDTSVLGNVMLLENLDKYLFKRSARTDTIFNHEDRVFLFEQFNAIIDTTWRENFGKARLISNPKEVKHIHYFSVPLFSVDNSHAIIYRMFFCGNLCAYIGYYVYRRLDNQSWEFLTAVNVKVS